MVVIDAGERQYELVEGWGEMRPGQEWGLVGAVAVDSQDRVHVFTRSNPPYRVFDRSGKLLYAWGEQIFMDAHGICIGPDDSVYLVDREPQLVYKYTNEGRHILTLGKRDQPSDTGYEAEGRIVRKPGPPFHHPTDVSITLNGEFYVSDGYRNCRIHKYSADGQLLSTWGEFGTGPGQFTVVHSVWEHRGKVYVADRENNRIQIFTPEGKYIAEWGGFVQPTKIFVDKDDVMYVAELGARVSILDLEGNLLGRWGGDYSHAPGQFWGPHGIWTDSWGDLYVAEVTQGARLQKFARKR